MARLAALLANGGKLVTPHLVSSVEQPSNPGAIKAVFSPAPKDVIVDPDELNVIEDGLFRDARVVRNLGRRLRRLPGGHRRQDGTAEKAVDVDGDGYAQMVDQSWWCGYGPTDKTPELVVRVDRERRPREASAAALAALEDLRAVTSGKRRLSSRPAWRPTDGGLRSLSSAARQGAIPAPTRARCLVRPPARLGDARRRRGLVGFGLWAIDGITRQDIAGDPDYYVTRQAIFALMGTVGLVGALLIDPSVYRRYYKALYGSCSRCCWSSP